MVRSRLDTLVQFGSALQTEGVPFPTDQIRSTVEQSLEHGETDSALAVLKRGEVLYNRTAQNWTWVRELLRRADELREIATLIGVDVQHLDARVGNARQSLETQPLSAGSLEKAAASASLSLAVLNDTIPKFCVQEGLKLGGSIRAARKRGEDASEATKAFSTFLQAVQDEHTPTTAQRLVDVRKAVARIPRAPILPAISSDEEEEILLEARNLARRLHRIKSKARDAPSAARLMTQVRAALSEDRRYGTPEEEIEALWQEVDRMTQERRSAADEPGPLEGLPPVGPELLSAANGPVKMGLDVPDPEDGEREDLDPEGFPRARLRDGRRLRP